MFWCLFFIPVRLAMLATIEQPVSTIPSKTYSATDLSRLFGVSVETVHNWHQAGELPAAAFQLKRTLRWTEDQVRGLFAKRGA
jgi:hypothetical protein